jgi:predicted GH43/DUF377 family glycosyl hydrolase
MPGLQISVQRSEHNPLLTPLPDLKWASKKVYNPTACVDDEGVLHMIFRASGDDSVSRLGHALSREGVSLQVEPSPVCEPKSRWESHGCEDPRVTRIADRYWMSYTAFDGRTARVALTSTRDFRHWEAARLMLPDWNEGLWNQREKRHIILPGFDSSIWRPDDATWSKAAALFPEQIGGAYWAFFGEDQIWCATSKDLNRWEAHKQPVLSPRQGHFDSAYLEMGPAPTRTSFGWLIIYNGVDRFDQRRTYAIGVAVCALEDPTRVLWRCDHPILRPERDYEISGVIDVADPRAPVEVEQDPADQRRPGTKRQGPLAVFCCGSVDQSEGRLSLYYGAADRAICLAEAQICAR